MTNARVQCSMMKSVLRDIKEILVACTLQVALVIWACRNDQDVEASK